MQIFLEQFPCKYKICLKYLRKDLSLFNELIINWLCDKIGSSDWEALWIFEQYNEEIRHNIKYIVNIWLWLWFETNIFLCFTYHPYNTIFFAYLKVTGKSVPDIWKVFIKENKNTKVILSRKKHFKLKASWMF